MYRIGLENILGIRLDAGDLAISPCIPTSFAGYEVSYRHGAAVYRIVVENPDGASSGVARIDVDGETLTSLGGTDGARVKLTDDGRAHDVRVVLARPAPMPVVAAAGTGGPASKAGANAPPAS